MAKAAATQIETGFGLDLEMVRIPRGSFVMGAPEDKNDSRSDEGPPHKVRLDGFWIGKFTVTAEQWAKVMGGEPSGEARGGRLPMVSVSWIDAMKFCRKLSRKTGRAYTLPTEAQWEYACRAGTTTRFSFGDDDGDLADHAWYEKNSEGRLYEVGLKRPNAWGLHDMHGNIWEWCADWGGAYAAGEQRNPTGPRRGTYRISRGGSRLDAPRHCRSAVRFWAIPSHTHRTQGFRVARVLEARG